MEQDAPCVKEADEDFYTQRPPEMDAVCAFDLFAGIGKKYVQRPKLVCPVVKPYIKLDLTKDEGNPMFSRYCEQRLRLFKPWRFTADLYGEHVDEQGAIDWPAAYHAWLDIGEAPLLELRRYDRALAQAIEEIEKALEEKGGGDDGSDVDAGVDIHFHDSEDEADPVAAGEQNWNDELFRPNPDFRDAGGDEASHPVAAVDAAISCETLAGDFAHTRSTAATWLDRTIEEAPPFDAAAQRGLPEVDPSTLEGEQLIAVRIVREHLLARLVRAESPSDSNTGSPPSDEKPGAFTMLT
jgi:hypothetical protein